MRNYVPDAKQWLGASKTEKTNILESVSVKPGHKSDYFNRIYPELSKLANDIDGILKGKGKEARVELFDSGYYGIVVELSDDKTVYVFDQKGVVGQEDQSMPYIALRENGKELFRFSPDYHKRTFGDVGMEDTMRKDAYDKVKEYFKNL